MLDNEKGFINIQLFAEPSEETLDMDIDDLFKDPEESQLPNESSNDELNLPEQKGEVTQNMINRINTVKRNTEKEVADRIAKEQGYDSYADMKKARENEIVSEHGFNPKDVEAVLEPLLQQRLADDPRLKKLEELEQRERNNYINTALTSINKVTGQQLKIEDLDKETLDLWSKGVDLEKAYYAVHSKSIITKGISQIQNGTLNHLAPSSNSGNTKTRNLTKDEKSMFSSILSLGGYSITDKELSEKIINREG